MDGNIHHLFPRNCNIVLLPMLMLKEEAIRSGE